MLGVDTGTKRVGLAICDADRIIASPLETLDRCGPEREAQFYRNLIARESVVGIVIGLPMHTDGREGVKAQEARTYGNWLAQITALPVEYADERFTTVHAESALWAAGLTHQKRKVRRDRVAAQIMLQAYLDDGK
jgi:putative Holliday junction resolvase